MPVFMVALSTTAKLGCQPMDEYVKKMWYIPSMEDYSVIKVMKSCHLKEKNGTGSCYVKYNKPDTEERVSRALSLYVRTEKST